MESLQLNLKKENLKFSAAHFLIFDEKNAERLHGHNYSVTTQFGFSDSSMVATRGFCVDFGTLKEFIKKNLDQWDERVLLPASHPEMKIQINNNSCEVKFRDRFYVFPADEVVLLPIANTSVELFSKLLAEIFFVEFKKVGITKISVLVEETPGQGAETTLSVSN